MTDIITLELSPELEHKRSLIKIFCGMNVPLRMHHNLLNQFPIVEHLGCLICCCYNKK